MWTCPKCELKFESQNQNHSCSKPPKSIEEYIGLQTDSIQSVLNQIDNTICTVLPDAQKRIAWKMPTYWNEHNIIHFAAFKNHIGLYPGSAAIQHFSDSLVEYKTSKGAIQFPYSKPIPLKLIAEIAQWCYTTKNHH